MLSTSCSQLEALTRPVVKTERLAFLPEMDPEDFGFALKPTDNELERQASLSTLRSLFVGIFAFWRRAAGAMKCAKCTDTT